ncbi:MAG TPA: OmpH family outer membrane protein [Cytophagaceae bacterium]|nr:OmpH family outer membrane protein [Cytophagaceae bacterium]
MQKISIAINAVLLIAVGVLFYMVFSLKKQVSGEVGTDSLSMVSLPLPKADGKIMFVNVDSLKAKYDYFLKIEADLLKKGKANEAEIKNMYDVFQKSYQKYQEQGQAGTMTEQQIEMAQRDLAQKEKTIREREELITQNFSKEAEKMNQQFLKYVLSYLKKKSKEHNYSYVMGYAEGSNLLYVNDSLDITKQVVNGLNADYKATPGK